MFFIETVDSVTEPEDVCNLCLRPVGPDGSMGLCGGCRRQETPESQA